MDLRSGANEDNHDHLCSTISHSSNPNGYHTHLKYL